MAPTFYHYSPLRDMEAQHMEKGKLLCSWDRVLQLVLQVLTFIAIVVLMFLVRSSACQDGLCNKHERLNTTGVLEQQLEQTQRELSEAQKQVVTYNHTVATLTDSLEKQEKDHFQTMQKKEEEHQREIQILKQQQEMSEKLKSSGKLCEDKVTSASSGNTLHRYVLTFLLLLWALIFV